MAGAEFKRRVRDKAGRALRAVVWLAGGLMALSGSAAQAKPVDDIFLDHPSMDRNATTQPAADAQPVRALFHQRAILDASMARADDGTWFLTGTPQRDGPKDGVRLWSSRDQGGTWKALGAVHGAGRRMLAPDIAVRGAQLYLTFQDQDGCARIAIGSVADPQSPYRESPCLVDNADHPSLFLDQDATAYLLWGGGHIARLTPDLQALAEGARFLKPDPTLFARLPEGQDWPVRVRIGEKGATMFRDGDRYVVVASEVTGRMRAPTEDVFMATGPTPYGPFTRRFLAVPHAGRTSIMRDGDGALWATYNPQCADHLAYSCEQVGLVRLEPTAEGRLRPDPTMLTENSGVARLQPAPADIQIRDPSVTAAADGTYYMVGTTGKNREVEGELALWRSSDLREWTQTQLKFDRAGLGRTFTNVVALWAPEIKWVAQDRTFYLSFSMMERDVGGKTWIYRSVSGRAEGPYENVAKANLVDGIDGFLFEDGDGLYLLWGGGNLGKLNAKRDGFERPPVKLLDTDGEPVGYEGNGLVRIGDTYFITGAEWNGPLRTHGTYDMMYGASRSVWGPYSKRQVGAPHAGHGTVFQDQGGRWWTTMFGNDVTSPYRKRFGLVPLQVDGAGGLRTDDGTPIPGGKGPGG